MTSGRFIFRGWAWQARAFAAWNLAGATAVAIANQTTRFAIVGTSRERIKVHGTSRERLMAKGISRERLKLSGSSE